MITITIITLIIYSSLIIALINGFNRIKPTLVKNSNCKINFTIIIPFRNEAKNLPHLLHGIKKLNYPNHKFEVLLINDNSTDSFRNTINDFKLQNSNLNIYIFDNVRVSNSPKKDAIAMGINNANHEWIITTDADCSIPTLWLKQFDAIIQNENPKMVVAPVLFHAKNKFLDKFQSLDFMGLQGSTIGGFGIHKPFLCNGANLAYQKESFNHVKGFEGNNTIASGDDIFLLEKMIEKYPKKVKYLKNIEACTQTKPEENWKQLIQQRIRWASKTTSYNNPFGKNVGVIVFLTNFYFVTLFTLSLFKIVTWQHFAFFFLVKFNVDFILLYKTTRFFKQEKTMNIYLTSSFIHPFFTVMIALLSFKKEYEWKGRTFKK